MTEDIAATEQIFKQLINQATIDFKAGKDKSSTSPPSSSGPPAINFSSAASIPVLVLQAQKQLAALADLVA